MVRIPHRLIVTALACTLIAAAPAPAALPAALSAALDQAPTGAQVIIVVPNMAEFSDKVAALRQDLDLRFDDLDDVLGNFKRRAGMTEGIDDAGAIAFVLTDIEQAAQADQPPPMTLLVPVTDYQAFVEQYGGKANGAVSSLTMPKGQAGFARQAGDYAVLCQTQAGAEAFAPAGAASSIAKQVGTLGEKYLSSGDLVVYIDATTVGPALLPAIKKGMNRAAAGPTGQAAANPNALNEVFFDTLASVIDDCQTVVAALDLADSGVGMTYTLQYKADSTLAKVLPGGSQTAAKLLAALPDQPYVFAAALDLRALNLNEVLDEIFQRFPTAEQNPMLAAYKEAMPLVKQAKGSASVFYAPDPNNMMGMANLFNALNVYHVDDGAAYMDATKSYFDTLNGLSLQMGNAPAPGAAAAPAISYVTRYTENAMEIEGVQVDQYSFNINMPPELIQGNPLAPMMMGFTNYQGFVAAKADHVVMTTSVDPQLLTKALAAVDRAAGIGSTGPIAQVRDAAMPPHPVMESYVSVSGVAQVANGFLPLFLGIPPIQVPEGLPPLCAAAGIQDSGVALRIYLPNQSLKFISDTITSIKNQQAGQGGLPGAYPRGTQPPPFN